MQGMYVGERGLMVFCDRFVAITGFCFFLVLRGIAIALWKSLVSSYFLVLRGVAIA